MPGAARGEPRARRRISLRLGVAIGVVIVYVLVATFGPFITHFNSIETNVLDRLLPPGGHGPVPGVHWLGTDWLGRDMVGEIIQGARISLEIGAATIGLSLGFGTLVGIVAGFSGGLTDSTLMRIADIQLAFPSIILAIFIAAALGSSVLNVVIALSLASWVIFARIARAETIAIKHKAYVEASRLLGAGRIRIMRCAILPSTLRSLSIYATVQFGFVIVAEAALSFLGVGVPASDTSWGTTIFGGESYLSSAWWISTLPGIALAVLVVCMSIIGDELSERLS
ncbi:MAG: ABC transporter permease [Actinomycetota bacterium]|nr:ABC transporter permease [Actinomycetota bacterium]